MNVVSELLFSVFVSVAPGCQSNLNFLLKKISLTENILESSNGKDNDFHKLINSPPSEYVEEKMLKISSQKLELFGR